MGWDRSIFGGVWIASRRGGVVPLSIFTQDVEPAHPRNFDEPGRPHLGRPLFVCKRAGHGEDERARPLAVATSVMSCHLRVWQEPAARHNCRPPADLRGCSSAGSRLQAIGGLRRLQQGADGSSLLCRTPIPSPSCTLTHLILCCPTNF